MTKKTDAAYMTIDGYPYESCTDSELLNEQKQLKISISCGPGPTVLERMEKKLAAIRDELVKRESVVKVSKERIARQAQQQAYDLTRRYISRAVLAMVVGDAENKTATAILGEILVDDEQMRHYVRDMVATISREILTIGKA